MVAYFLNSRSKGFDLFLLPVDHCLLLVKFAITTLSLADSLRDETWLYHAGTSPQLSKLINPPVPQTFRLKQVTHKMVFRGRNPRTTGENISVQSRDY
ncbi:MAG: hypothetical protein DMF40_08350 [Verrucomicrobia bacterium]|nr:MAG: hypothetical protein DMF40_08350 [Verrucomicrobiota bacterium]